MSGAHLGPDRRALGLTFDNLGEAADELGTHVCIPPRGEDRRSEIWHLEPIETVATVVG